MSTGYLPDKDKDKATWLTAFANALQDLFGQVGVTLPIINDAKTDAAYFGWLVTCMEIINQSGQGFTKFKNQLRSGPRSPVPVPPVQNTSPPAAPATTLIMQLPLMPTLAYPDIIGRTRATAERIKAQPDYTKAIGEKLGIIGADDIIDINNLQPLLREGEHLANGVVIKWNKGPADGIRFYLDKHDGQGFLIYGVDMQPDWLLSVPLPAGQSAITVDLFGVYIIGDEEVGKKSEAIQVTIP